MPLSPSIGTAGFLERWITAADQLGPAYSAGASTMVNDIAAVIRTTGDACLADTLREQGPLALCRLEIDDRRRTAERVGSTMSPSLLNALRNESIAMERRVGVETPVRVVVFGNLHRGGVAKKILSSEFEEQRGIAVSLERPTPDALATLSLTRHQLFWPEPPSGHGRATAIKRLPCPNFFPPPEPGDLWNLSRLSLLHPVGAPYTAFASKNLVPLEAGDLLRIGGLVLAQDISSPPIADVLFASAQAAISSKVPVAFFRASPDRTSEADRPERRREGRVRVPLGPVHQHYGTADRALPAIAHYLEWLERHPESGPDERGDELKHLEEAAMTDLPPELQQMNRHLLRRDFFHLFISLLKMWGARTLQPESSVA